MEGVDVRNLAKVMGGSSAGSRRKEKTGLPEDTPCVGCCYSEALGTRV